MLNVDYLHIVIYFCFIFASAPLFIIFNLIADIYGIQTFDFKGIGFLSIPKYLVYNLGNVPTYLCFLGLYRTWFMKETLNMSFNKQLMIRLWVFLIILIYILTTSLSCTLFYYFLLTESLENYIFNIVPSFLMTPFFEGSFFDFIAYSLVCIALFIAIFFLNVMIL